MVDIGVTNPYNLMLGQSGLDVTSLCLNKQNIESQFFPLATRRTYFETVVAAGKTTSTATTPSSGGIQGRYKTRALYRVDLPLAYILLQIRRSYHDGDQPRHILRSENM